MLRPFAALTAILAIAACAESDPQPVTPPTTLSTGPGGMNPSGPGGGGSGGSSNGGGGSDGGMAPVHLGLNANPLSPQGPSEHVFAELTVLAAGVRSVHVDVPFTTLDAADLDALAVRLADYQARNLRVVVTLLMVDGAVAHRPPATDGLAWDDATTLDALELLVDGILQAGGDAIDALVFSRALDAYLEAHPDEREALTAATGAGIEHVTKHAPALLTAAGLRFVAEPDAAYLAVLERGNAAALSYTPGLGEGMLPEGISPAHDLDAMIALAPDRPILMQAAAFPSSANLASSPELQAQNLEALVTALEPRRASFPIVNLDQLHDLDEAQCDALLAAQGLLPGDPHGDYVCSAGLRDTVGEPKPAWDTFIQAAARFAGP